jgi:hypothetical protein
MLKVHSFLTVHMSPQHQTVNSGSAGTFNCSVSSSGDSQIEWFHNGKSIVGEKYESTDELHGKSEK